MKKCFFYYIIMIVLICSCQNRQMQIKEMSFYDYIYDGNKRVKGYLVNKPSKNIKELEEFLCDNTEKILSKDFVQNSLGKINNTNLSNNDKMIEIDFFRVSKEIPWEIKEDYVPPYHMGEGNPSDWIGRFIYNIDEDEIYYYFVCTRANSLFDYGTMKEHIEYKKMQ